LEKEFNNKIKQQKQEIEVDIEPVVPVAHEKTPPIQLEKFVVERNASIFDNELKSSEEHPSYQSINNFTDYKVIGEIFSEFLILEKDDVMLLVDFHAGHERLLYDKLVEKVNSSNIDIQTLLVPYTHQLNVQEIDYISNIADSLKVLGFEVSQIGPNEICIYTVPVMLSDINLKDFVEDLLHDMNNKKPKINNELDRMLMQKACKSAVKSGMTLNMTQIQELLKNLDINQPVLLCPHGRPIVTVVKRSQIEKWFKRIV
jgi:DNA mismatch repair protein MutL